MAGERLQPSARTQLLVLLGVALGVRLAWWATHITVIENEGVEYATIARTWFSGEGYLGILGGTEVMFPPLYSFLIGVADFVLRDLVTAGRVISLAAGLALVAITFSMTRRVFGENEGLIAGTIAAIHPLLVALSTSMYVESLAVCLVMGCAWFALLADRDGRWWTIVASGAAAGLAYLARPEMIVFVVPAGAYIGYSTFRRTHRLSSALGFAALPLLVSALIALPYMVHLSAIAGQFRWEGKTAVNEVINQRMTAGMTYARAARGLDVTDNFAAKVPYLGGPELWADQSAYLRSPDPSMQAQGPLDLIRAMPGRTRGVVTFLIAVSYEWMSVLRLPIGMLAIAVGVLSLQWWKPGIGDRALLLMAFAGLQALFLLGVQFLWVRYVVPLLPLAIPWISAGIMWASRKLSTRFALPIGLVAAALLCGNAYPRVLAFEDFRQAQDGALKDVGLWIGQHWTSNHETGGRHPIIMGYGAVVPFYADGFLNYLPHTDDAELALDYVRWKSPDYIVLRRSETTQGPYFEAWLGDGIPDSCAEPVLQQEEGDGVIQVWQWRCQP